VLRASYDRAFQTPAAENLLLASSPAVDVLSHEVVRLPVRPSRGNFYEAGLSKTFAGALRLDATGYRRIARNFADDDVLLNTGVSFPIALAHASVNGAELTLTVPQYGRWSGSAGYSLMRGTAQLPVTGGLLLGDEGDALLHVSNTIPVSQDQRHTAHGRVNYQITESGWAALAASYGSGLPFEFTGTQADAVAQYGFRTVDRVDFETGRVRPRLSLDAAAGVVLGHRSNAALRLQVDVRNMTNRLDVINFAGLFSGTALAPPRSVDVRISAEF
jgi:outer membrane receptor for Fe3+-dicitrate